MFVLKGMNNKQAQVMQREYCFKKAESAIQPEDDQ